MRAVGYKRALAIEDENALLDVELAEPIPGENDLLVEIKAVSVNPVDTKIRRTAEPAQGEIKVLGWDASGKVLKVGSKVTLFQPGDDVWYAGSILRPGTNSEYHVVDEKIVGKMPASFTYAQAAALPLTAITAWELLFDRLQVLQEPASVAQQLLIIGAAGGVGSILLQLARQRTNMTIIGTASRPESVDWALKHGAHFVIDHQKPLSSELQRIGIPSVTHVAGLTQTEQHFDEIVEILAPQGKLALIDDPKTPLNIIKLKPKSISLHWEFMFTRSSFNTHDVTAQHNLLNTIGDLVNQGKIVSTVAQNLGVIQAKNLRQAHTLIESGKSRGKVVLEGFA